MKKIYKRNWLFELKSLAVMGTLLFAGTAAAQLNGSYVIDAGGTGDFLSFTELADTLDSDGVSGAVIVDVKAGGADYSETFELEDITGSSATNTITINGNGNTIKDGGTVIELDEVFYVSFDSLNVDVTGSTGKNYHILGGSENISITNSNLTRSGGSYTSSSSIYIKIGDGNTYNVNASTNNTDITIDGNTLSAPSGKGAYCGISNCHPTSASADQNITITNNDITSIRFAIYNEYISGLTVSNNEIHNPAGFYQNYMYGIYVYNADYSSEFSGAGQNTINANHIYNFGDNITNYYYTYGMYFLNYYGSDNYDITNNVIDYQNGGSRYGIYHRGGYPFYGTGAPGEANITNNTVSLTGTHTYSSNYQRLIYSYYNSGDIKNNILYSNSTNTFYFYGIYGGQLTGDVSNNNLHFEDNAKFISGANNHRYAYLNANIATQEDWLNSSSDPMSVNPNFVDVSLHNLRPNSVAMANSAEVVGYVTEDFDGVARSTTPDMGSYEYFVDIEVVSVDMVGTTTECAPYSEDVTITIKNNGAYSIGNIPLQYSINSGIKVSEVMAGPLASGATTQFTFNETTNLYSTMSHEIESGVDGVDDVDANSYADHTIGTIQSPTGGSLAQGSSFDGYFNAGTKSDPDVTVNTYASLYDITRPKVATTGPSATSYTYSLKATNNFGIDVTASGFPYTALAEDFTVDPATTLAGDTIFMELSVLDANTGCDTSFGRWIYVPHTPVASFNSANICLGDVAQFKNTSTLAGADYIVTRWEFDDPDASITDDNSDIKDGFWEYSTYGNGVTVEMTVANGLYPKFEYPTTNTINVTPTPEIDFKVLNACEGTPITIANSTTLPTASPITYTWDFGGVGTSTLENPSYTFATPGIREVTVVASANGCESTLTKNAYQFEKPIASFTNTGECNFVDVAFMSTSTIPNEANMGYSWDFNGSGISREESPAFAFATPGTKSVTLTATSEFGCVDAITQNISLNESPVADFDWEKACNLTPIAFNFTGSVPAGNNSSYSWDFAGEATASRVDPEAHLFSKVGTKLVTLTIADLNGCTNTITKEVNVVLQALADFEAASVCEGAEAVFTNKSEVAAGGLSYKWSFGDGPTSTSEDLSPTHTYGEARTYNVTLEAIVEGGCSDLITKDVVVNPSPIAAFAPNKDGRTVVPTATQSGNDAYRWTFGDGGSSSEENPTYTYVNVDEGTYTVCLATREGDCWNENCEDITISLLGIANLTESDDMINVYPNPTTGKFTISVDNASEVVVKVGDILGNVLDIEVRDNLNGEYSVDMSAVADGVYFVQVRNGDFYATKRITVSK